jgi:hypothetical protein
MGYHFGVDVSSNNAHPMNYQAIAMYLTAMGDGASPFVIVKATQGTGYHYSGLAGDVAGFRAVGITAVAAYLMDEGTANVTTEETFFQQQTTLPQADDIELPNGLTVAEYIAHSQGLVNVNHSVLSYLNQSEVVEGFPQGEGLWLAEYNREPLVVSHPCWVHQYDDALVIPGTGGVFDANVWLGTEAQFSAFFRLSASPAPIKLPPPTSYPGDNMIETPITIAIGSGKGWCPSPVPAGKVVTVVMEDENPDVVARYDTLPVFTGRAQGAGPHSPNGALVFTGAVDGTFGATVISLD